MENTDNRRLIKNKKMRLSNYFLLSLLKDKKEELDSHTNSLHLKLSNIYKSPRELEINFMELYIKMLKNDPKPREMSKSDYLMYITLQIFPMLGNICPSQEEIDALESIVKRYSNRKLIKPMLANIVVNSTT